MAKRGAVQLQADLQTDEDFENFIRQPGLLVIDVYTEWCGPCLGMLSTLRRLKMEIGEHLQLAIAKADTIFQLHRFFKKSEPTWLFLTDGKAVNILFGSDTPKLTQTIYDEVKLINKLSTRDYYQISESLPEEKIRDRIKNEAKEAKLLKERLELEKKKSEYFEYVTNTIRENLPDIGISIFGPQVHRDLFRRLIEFGAEKFNIQCKDRRNQPITKEQFAVINTLCKNPLSDDIIEALDGKELYICFWKIPDDYINSVPEVLESFADEITKVHVLPPDEYREEEEIIPPLVAPTRFEFEYELSDDQECPEIETEQQKDTKPRTSEADMPENEVDEDRISEMGSEEDEVGDDTMLSPTDGPDFPLDDMTMMLSDDEEEDEETIEEVPKKNICKRYVTVPPIWVPKDKRTHAAIIYVLFRQQTLPFLPPDPVPDPPHVIMAFDTYKKRDLIDFAERNKEDIPLYGFFTSDDAEEATFIANSKHSYAHHTSSVSDKLVFKVNKRTSHTMLSLVTYGPTYVSPNTKIGEEEAKLFFPENYISAEEEILLAAKKKEEARKSKKVEVEEIVTEAESIESIQQEPAAVIEEQITTEPVVTEAEEGAEEAGETGEDGGDIGEGPEPPPGESEAPEVAENPDAPTETAPEESPAEIPQPTE